VVERPAAFRYEGRWVGGEKEKLVNVVPPVSLRLTPPVAVFPAGGPSRREFRVPVRQYAKGKLSAVVHLELPAGWTVEPREARVTLAAEGEETVARFVVTSSAAAAEGQAPIAAVAAVNGHEFRQGDTVVAYDHIQERRLYRPATTRGLVLDVKVNPAARVGYVAGVGDEVAEAIGQLGVPLTALSADDLADGDLSRFSTIVTGVRAYQARPDLRRSQSRLMRWVEDGGHLVVQYNRGEFNPNAQEPSPYAPYPARVSTARITDETAPMEMLAPSSPLLTTPNRISSRDWAGWTQERAIQLFETQDSRYTDLLAAADAFPKNAGQKRGLLVDAAVGKGTWTYVALVLFRELPAGVPGAYRLLANLVSRPRSR